MTRLRLALDQDFPLPLLEANRAFLPSDIELAPLQRIDPRLPELGDRELVLALARLGWDGLVTGNDRMLTVPSALAAIVATKAVVVATHGLGHDPLRAAGALLLELPGLVDRLQPDRSNVFRLAYGQRRPRDAWTYLEEAARRSQTSASALWDQVHPDASEATRTP